VAQRAAGRPAAPAHALAEPAVSVRPAWIAGNTLANLGMWMAAYTPVQISLPDQLQAITPQHKVVALGVVTGLGAVAATFATPLAGALSDATRRGLPLGASFRGRRHSWTLAGAVLAAICLAILARQATVAGVAAGWFCFSAFQNAQYAGLSATIPDRVPVSQRATVAGWVGMPQALGLVTGAVLVTFIFPDLVSGYDALACVLVLSVLPFVLLSDDYPLRPQDQVSFSLPRLVSSYWQSARGHPDFGWAWLTRFLAMLGNAMGTLYLLYFLRDAVHYSRLFPGQTAQDGLFILIVIYTIGVVITAVLGGVLSDRIGRRKLLVTISGALMTVAAVLLALLPTWPSALAAAAFFGVGFGAYLAVDQALVTQVLPAARDRARDLGIINIANVGSIAIGAAIAAPLVSLGGYATLYVATAVVLILNAIGVWKIRSVP
jgi:MFS family permease